MPSKREKSEVAAGVAGIWIPPELLDQLVKGRMTADEIQAECLTFKKSLIDRAMGGEMTPHVGYRPGEARPAGQDDHRNASGLTVRKIQGFLAEQWGTEVSHEFISTVTDEVRAEVTADSTLVGR